MTGDSRRREKKTGAKESRSHVNSRNSRNRLTNVILFKNKSFIVSFGPLFQQSATHTGLGTTKPKINSKATTKITK